LSMCLAAGCTSIDKYNGLDAPPGGTVFGSSSFSRTMETLNPVPSGYGAAWTRIRVIAPLGASVCRIAGQSIFVAPGPEPEGKPNDKGEVMLSYDAEAKSASFECRMPSGVVKRTVEAVPFAIMTRLRSGVERKVSTAHVKPPLVHMDPTDPAAEARWAAISAELCPGPTLICEPGMLEKLKAEDLSEAS